MAHVYQHFAHEGDYPDLDAAGACERLGRALSIPTVDGPTHDETDWAAFDELERHLRASFPRVFSAASVERVDHSLLLTIPGTDAALRPALFLAHMDVVPVVPGTEGDWTHDAFSGVVDDEWIWGRGALDMTDHLMGMMEAVEHVLARGDRLSRTLIMALGQDEETFQSGSRSMGQLLLERGVRAEFSIDEGDYVVCDLAAYGAPGCHGMFAYLAEKGYADVRLTVRGIGGHSSNPFGGTTLGILSEAVARVARDPWPLRLTPPVRAAVDAIAPKVTEEPLRTLLREGDDARVAEAFASSRELFPLVTTTVAPTMLVGGSTQANVMPQDVSATINFRMLTGTTCQDVIDRVRRLVADLPVEVELLADVSNDPSQASGPDGVGYEALVAAAARYFVEPAADGTPDPSRPVAVVPSLISGATDSRMYECVCGHCLRFSPFVSDADEVDRGVHGTDERISRRAYLQGIRFFVRLLELAVV